MAELVNAQKSLLDQFLRPIQGSNGLNWLKMVGDVTQYEIKRHSVTQKIQNDFTLVIDKVIKYKFLKKQLTIELGILDISQICFATLISEKSQIC